MVVLEVLLLACSSRASSFWDDAVEVFPREAPADTFGTERGIWSILVFFGERAWDVDFEEPVLREELDFIELLAEALDERDAP